MSSDEADVPLASERLDHLCWVLVVTRNRFTPPDEMAQEMIELEGHDQDERKAGFTEGYFTGTFLQVDETIEHLEWHDVDVEDRAKAYADRKGIEL